MVLRKVGWILSCLTLGQVLLSCGLPSHSSTDPATAYLDEIRPLVEQLHLNQRALEGIYQDLRVVAEGHLLLGSEEQLSYIQKALLYIDKAQRESDYQWETLSILDYIKNEARRDYFSLRQHSLERAVRESVSDLTFLATYQAFIENRISVADIDKASDLINKNIRIYKQLMEKLTPLVDPPQPTGKIYPRF
jgi:hypothetical protein